MPFTCHMYINKQGYTCKIGMILSIIHISMQKYAVKATSVLASVRKVTLHGVRSKRQISTRQTLYRIKYGDKYSEVK